ncbi:MAG: GIY-YIG nuclease family protein [Anaerolinea sp.]|nr:GIY-YIG nuclease family protein [Anaerolinea sp.]
MPFYCYMVECADGSFYTGWTTNPQRRVQQHNRGRGAAYTRMHGPVHLVYLESQPDRSSAQRREAALKRLSHAKKQQLIQAHPLQIQEEL